MSMKLDGKDMDNCVCYFLAGTSLHGNDLLHVFNNQTEQYRIITMQDIEEQREIKGRLLLRRPYGTYDQIEFRYALGQSAEMRDKLTVKEDTHGGTDGDSGPSNGQGNAGGDDTGGGGTASG